MIETAGECCICFNVVVYEDSAKCDFCGSIFHSSSCGDITNDDFFLCESCSEEIDAIFEQIIEEADNFNDKKRSLRQRILQTLRGIFDRALAMWGRLWNRMHD